MKDPRCANPKGFQSHPLDQTTASLTLNFGWFQRTKKHYHCNAPFNIGRNLANKTSKHHVSTPGQKKTSYSTSIFSLSICLKTEPIWNICHFYSFLNYRSTPHLDPWCFKRQFSHHIFTTRWPRHLSAARSPNLRHRSLSGLPIVPPNRYIYICIYNV